MHEPEIQLPDHIHQLADGETFTFSCHPGVRCFTECCRELELALSPYDVLRLSRELGISDQQFLDDYTIIECEGTDTFPRVYLGMVDDGRASCPFITDKGCRVYEGRPAPCRTYPLGRGAWRDGNGHPQTFYVLQHEEHCKGFAEHDQQTVKEWIAGQGLSEYYKANDMLIPLLQHEMLKKGYRPTFDQQQLYLTTLYNLENFRNNSCNSEALTDLELLQKAVTLLIREFFG